MGTKADVKVSVGGQLGEPCGIWDMGYGIRDVAMWECGNARPDARDSKKDEVLGKKKKNTLPLCHSATLRASLTSPTSASGWTGLRLI